MGRKHPVHLGKALANPRFHLRLSRHAAAEKNFLLRMAALGMAQCTQVAKHPLLGMLPNGAGVHDPHIRPFGSLAEAIAARGQHSADPFGVRFILLTAIRLHIGNGRPAPAVPIRLNLRAQLHLGLHLLLGDSCGFPVQWGSLQSNKNNAF